MNQELGSWSSGIPRMVALAERCAAEGQMNLNKLLEAAAYAQVRRAAWHYRPLVTKESMPVELAETIQYLNVENASTELISTLERGYQNLVQHRNTDLTLDDAPDAYVCRTCGYLTFNVNLERCPTCGSWPGRFRKFVATFNMDNIDPFNPLQVILLFARNAVELKILIDGLSESQLTRKPAEDEWSIRDHVAHFYDAQQMLDTRLELMLNQEDPELIALAIYNHATEEQGRPATTADLLGEFLTLRRASVNLLESLPVRDWWRTGRHTEFGRITILRQVAYLAYHEQTHLPEIEALRKVFN